jgi:hypothetical protein
MSSLQQRLSAATDTITNLIAQLRELDRLCERGQESSTICSRISAAERAEKGCCEIAIR